ncbi:MAG: PIG-L family deacetylase [Anaerolineae bacterium]|nr:PIG-L family deacetylase [Anaerolineae bacterium]
MKERNASQNPKARSKRRWGLQWSPRLRIVFLGLLALLIVGVVRQEAFLARSDAPLEAYPSLSLEGYHRLLVLAPHCDDETLGAGGLIQAALREGMGVRVVIVTACDGYRSAAMAQFRRLRLRSEDFVALGELRRRESLQALARLGLHSTDDVLFLMYPERGSPALWWDYWEGDQPYRSPYSGLTCSPSGTPYDGQALLQGLRSILAADRPDIIVMPHPNDENIDHRALAAFVSLAVEMERAEDPTFQPLLLGYLVHYGSYPQPFGLKPGAFLRPPRQLESIGEWVVWRLSAEEVAAKQKAVDAYPSQKRLMAPYLNGFVRQNELFMRGDGAVSLGIMGGVSLADTDNPQAIASDVSLPALYDPVSDSVVRRLSSSADIEELRLIRLGDSLWIGLNLRGRANRAYSYDLYARAITATGSMTWSRRYRQGADDMWQAAHTIWYRLDLGALHHPDWLVLTAETRRGLVLDRTAWHVIRLEESPFG